MQDGKRVFHTFDVTEHLYMAHRILLHDILHIHEGVSYAFEDLNGRQEAQLHDKPQRNLVALVQLVLDQIGRASYSEEEVFDSRLVVLESRRGWYFW